MTPEERARKSADALLHGDAATKWIGMELLSVGEGRADMALRVEAHHCNGHGTCHGGVIFSLADSAFAFACNSRNQVAVAQSNSITYLAPGRLGDTLTAQAREVHTAGRSGVYDVQVCDGTGAAIAQFRGLSRILSGQVFDEPTEAP